MDTRKTDSNEDPLREIPMWAERYANTKTRPVLLAVWMAMALMLGFALVFALVMAASIRTWNPAVIAVGAASCIALIAVWLWLARGFARWLFARAYREGVAVPPLSSSVETNGAKLRGSVLRMLRICAGWFVFLLLYVLQYLESRHVLHIGDAMLQPVMATVLAPIAVVWIVFGKKDPRWPWLVWPGLYALHAVLIFTGVIKPLFGGGRMEVWMPITVYGLVTLIVVHLYSRYALWRLRILTQVRADGAPAEEGNGDAGN